jgi:hypothetical protein
MNRFFFHTLTVACAITALTLIADRVHAQTYRYYVPQTNSVRYYQAPTYTSRSYSAYQPTRSYSSARPVSGYGANLHRNFVIRQELQRSARTGQPPRRRGNIYWRW